MSFGLCRIRKISTQSGLSYTDTHNARLYQERGLKEPENIREQQRHGINSHQILVDGCSSIEQAVNQRIKEAGAKVRKNSVKAVEYVLALSPDVQSAYEKYSADAILGEMIQFLDKRHGKENVVSMSIHFDESNPHAHYVVVPLVTKEKKWKNRNGEGVKVENTLAARDTFGTRAQMRQMQTDFYEFCKEAYSERLNIEFKRGTDAREQSKKYTKNAAASIGDLRSIKADLVLALNTLKELRKRKKEAQKTLYKREAQQKREGKEQIGKLNFDKLNPFKGYPKKTKNKPDLGRKNKSMGM